MLRNWMVGATEKSFHGLWAGMFCRRRYIDESSCKRGTDMHHSRLCALLIDCKTSDVDDAARFWADALGRSVDPGHPGSRGNYRMLETPPDEPIVQIQRA
jgi:hypothetical protein